MLRVLRICLLLVAVCAASSPPTFAIAVHVPSSALKIQNIAELDLFTTLVPSLLKLTKHSCTRMVCSLYVGIGSVHANDMTVESVHDSKGRVQQIEDALSFFLPTYRIDVFTLESSPASDIGIAHAWSSLVEAAFVDGASAVCMTSDNAAVELAEWPMHALSQLVTNPFLPGFGVTAIASPVISINGVSSLPQQQQFAISCLSVVSRPLLQLADFGRPGCSDAVHAWLIDVYSVFNSSFVLFSKEKHQEEEEEKEEKSAGALQATLWHTYPRRQEIAAAIAETGSPQDLEVYIDTIHMKRRELATWLVQSRQKPSYEWNPASLAYRESGIYHGLYCAQTTGFLC